MDPMIELPSALATEELSPSDDLLWQAPERPIAPSVPRPRLTHVHVPPGVSFLLRLMAAIAVDAMTTRRYRKAYVKTGWSDYDRRMAVYVKFASEHGQAARAGLLN